MSSFLSGLLRVVTDAEMLELAIGLWLAVRGPSKWLLVFGIIHQSHLHPENVFKKRNLNRVIVQC